MVYDGYAHDVQGRPVSAAETAVGSAANPAAPRECKCYCCQKKSAANAVARRPEASSSTVGGQTKWCTAYAPSSRSKCGISGKVIPKGELRVGRWVPSPHLRSGARMVWKWYLPQYLFGEQTRVNIPARLQVTALAGYDKLRPPDQRRLGVLLSNAKRNHSLAPPPRGPEGPLTFQRLVLDALQRSRQVLVFCANKKWCGAAASAIVRAMEANGSIVPEVSATVANARAATISTLTASPDGISPDLQRMITFGVAFHNTDLSNSERAAVESAFRSGCIRVLTGLNFALLDGDSQAQHSHSV